MIEDYAASTLAPAREQTEVTHLRADDGGFVVTVPDGTIHARRVVVATGPFQRPHLPSFAEAVPQLVLQTDPTRYRRPEELPDGAGYDFPIWYGVWAPSVTPSEIVEDLANDIASAISAPDVRNWLVGHGMEPMSMTPEAFARFVIVNTARGEDHRRLREHPDITETRGQEQQRRSDPLR